MEVSIRRLSKAKRPVFDWRDGLEKDTDYVVWWYGGVQKNQRAQSSPKIAIFFRKMDKNKLLLSWKKVYVAIGSLSALRIGTIWNNGYCNSEIEFEINEFKVDFTRKKWEFISPSQFQNSKREFLIDYNSYALKYQRDKNWLVSLSQNDNYNIIIPCTEILIRLYGRSQEVSRIIMTYNWNEVQERLSVPFDEPRPPGTWAVKLQPNLYNGDVTYVAHTLYDEYTKHVSKEIYAQIEAAYYGQGGHAFIKVSPWFQGPATIKVSGLWINNHQTFLALRLLGCSDPKGRTILRDRQNTNKTDTPSDEDGKGKGWKNGQDRNQPDHIKMTNNDEPDQDGGSLEEEEDDFEILGEPRAIVDIYRDKAKTSSGTKIIVDGSDGYSPGEPHGTQKDVGHVSIHAKPVFESEGTLRDMWNAFRWLKNEYPEKVLSVEWFTFEDGFKSDEEPKLIALIPIPLEDVSIETSVRNWVYYDLEREIPRGIFVVRLKFIDKIIYIFEIQRRKINKKDDLGYMKKVEEPLTGLVFELKDENLFLNWLNLFLSRIRYQKGVMKNLTGLCTGTAEAFKHSSSFDDQFPCHSALLNALSKMDINLN